MQFRNNEILSLHFSTLNNGKFSTADDICNRICPTKTSENNLFSCTRKNIYFNEYLNVLVN